jgi:integrase
LDHKTCKAAPKKLLDQVRAKPSQHVPTVLSRAEVQAVLHEMSGIYLLMARLLYGSGMRLMDVSVYV